MLEKILRSNNYLVAREKRPAYRGALSPVGIVRVQREGFSGYAKEAHGEELEHFRRIQTVQDRIPHLAKIHEIIGIVVVIAEAPGDLLVGIPICAQSH